MNPNKRPPPSSSTGTFEGGDATKRARDHPDKILRPGQEQPGNVLLVRVTDIVHPVTILALQQIFSRFGKVDKIVMFDKGSGSQALVQMANVHTAMSAHEAADMQEMYSGCNLIRVGYSNLQNVTVKGNTERSWDFNIGPPLEGALPPGVTPAPTAATGVGANGYRGAPAASASPVTQGPPNPPSSTSHRHTPQQSYSSQQYSPYSAAQQPQATPYAPPAQQHLTYTPPHQSYGAPSAPSTYSPQHQQQQHQQQQQPYGNLMPSGGGGSYTSPSYVQQGYAPPYGQTSTPPFSQQPYNPQPYGQHGYSSRGGARGGSSDDNGGASGSNGIAAAGSGSYSRPPPPHASTNYYTSPANNVMPSPQSGPYGSIPFSSERSPGGFGSMGMGGGVGGGGGGGSGSGGGGGGARAIPHSGRPGRGGGTGGPGVGGLGGGSGGGQGRAAAGRGPPLGPGGGGGSGLLQAPMHRQGPMFPHDNGNYRSQMRFRSSDRKPTTNAAPGGAIKPRSRVPRLDPVQIQALTAAAAVAKKSARQPKSEAIVEGRESGSKAAAVAGRGRGGGDGKTLSGFVKEGAGSRGGSGNKTANKREAAEMLGPDATEQLAAATAKVFLEKRTNKREAAEMLGPDATDQLAAATAKVRVSDDGDGEDASLSAGKDVEAGDSSEKAGSRQDESKRKACAVEGDDEGEKGNSGKRTAGAGGGSVGEEAPVEGVVTRRGGLRSGSRGGGKDLPPEDKTKGEDVAQEDKTKADGVEVAEGEDPSMSQETGEEKVEGAAQCDGTTGNAEEGEQAENGENDEETESEPEVEAGVEDKEKEEEEEEEKLEAGDEVDDRSKGRDEVEGGEKQGEGKAGDGAEGEIIVKVETEDEADAEADAEGDGNHDDEDDEAAGDGEEERVDVGAWAAAGPVARSPIVMVRHVDTLEVSPGAFCQLFGLYGDVMKVKLVASRGMALVQMRYPVQAANAQRLLDQTPLSGMTLEVKPSSQWTINDPTATDFSGVQGLHRFRATPTPEDKRYRDSLSPPCPTLVVDNVSPDVTAETITSIFAKHGAVSSVDLDTHAKAPLDTTSALASTGGSNAEPTKPSVQALVHMEADGKVRATEAAVHALIMTHNLTLAERRLRVSFLSGEHHIEK